MEEKPENSRAWLTAANLSEVGVVKVAAPSKLPWLSSAFPLSSHACASPKSAFVLPQFWALTFTSNMSGNNKLIQTFIKLIKITAELLDFFKMLSCQLKNILRKPLTARCVVDVILKIFMIFEVWKHFVFRQYRICQLKNLMLYVLIWYYISMISHRLGCQKLQSWFFCIRVFSSAFPFNFSEISFQ